MVWGYGMFSGPVPVLASCVIWTLITLVEKVVAIIKIMGKMSFWWANDAEVVCWCLVLFLVNIGGDSWSVVLWLTTQQWRRKSMLMVDWSWRLDGIQLFHGDWWNNNKFIVPGLDGMDWCSTTGVAWCDLAGKGDPSGLKQMVLWVLMMMMPNMVVIWWGISPGMEWFVLAGKGVLTNIVWVHVWSAPAASSKE